MQCRESTHGKSVAEDAARTELMDGLPQKLQCSAKAAAYGAHPIEKEFVAKIAKVDQVRGHLAGPAVKSIQGHAQPVGAAATEQ